MKEARKIKSLLMNPYFTFLNATWISVKIQTIYFYCQMHFAVSISSVFLFKIINILKYRHFN